MEGLDKIFTQDNVTEVALNYEGVNINLKIRELSWSERTKILNDSFKYEDKGMTFNFEYYMKTTLSKIIVEAPWGETNNIFFSRITSKFGSMLETLVPKAFSEGDQPINFFA
jgi:hypothetical protein